MHTDDVCGCPITVAHLARDLVLVREDLRKLARLTLLTPGLAEWKRVLEAREKELVAMVENNTEVERL